jgi:hypothetical protein
MDKVQNKIKQNKTKQNIKEIALAQVTPSPKPQNRTVFAAVCKMIC